MNIIEFISIKEIVEEVTTSLEVLNKTFIFLKKSPDKTSILREVVGEAHKLRGIICLIESDDRLELINDFRDIIFKIYNEKIKVDDNIINILLKYLENLKIYTNEKFLYQIIITYDFLNFIKILEETKRILQSLNENLPSFKKSSDNIKLIDEIVNKIFNRSKYLEKFIKNYKKLSTTNLDTTSVYFLDIESWIISYMAKLITNMKDIIYKIYNNKVYLIINTNLINLLFKYINRLGQSSNKQFLKKILIINHLLNFIELIKKIKELLQSLNGNLFFTKFDDIVILNKIYSMSYLLKNMINLVFQLVPELDYIFINIQKLENDMQKYIQEIFTRKNYINANMVNVMFKYLNTLEEYTNKIFFNCKNNRGVLSMDMSQYLGVFIEETKEHLQSLNENLLSLEKSPDNMEILNEIFRVAHTLKGMAGTMGFNNMQKLTHDMENVLSEIRTGKIHINADIVDVLFKCLDALEKYTDEIINTETDGDEKNEDIILSLNAIINNTPIPNKKEVQQNDINLNKNKSLNTKKDNSKKQTNLTYFENDVVVQAINNGFNIFSITISLNKNCVLKSARAFIIFRTLETCNCEIIKANPSVEDIEDEKFDFSFTVMIITTSSKEILSSELGSIAEVEEVVIDKIGNENIVITDDDGNNIPDTHIEPQIIEPEIVSLPEQVEIEVSNKDKSTSIQSSSNCDSNKNKARTGKTVRVDIDRLDTLMNLVSELIIAKTRLEATGDDTNLGQQYHDGVEYLERITTSLHDAVMKVRMVPVEQVFNRFPRTIRDLSRSLNKEIELHISGEDTELDRIVIDEIGDPLLHLLRNAGDHGLEPTAKRVAVGKPKKGNIYLRAYQDGNTVVIEVEDDGGGIDVEKVRRKAIERGLFTQEEAAKLTEKDVVELLFKPSFSTAEKITDVSGRGVGLDVVKSKINALGGVIETKTELGKGSKFTVRLPMTLTIIQALMVKIGSEKYAIPLNTIQTIEDIKKTDIQYVQNKDVILLRDNVIPIINLAEILEVPDSQNDSDSFTIVIVKKGDTLAGLVVDSLIAQQEIVIRSLGKYLSGIKNITGATILGNGEVALILDTNTLV